MAIPAGVAPGHSAAATRAGVGYSEHHRSFDAGAEAARAALREAGGGSADLVLLFSTAKHDAVKLRDGVRSVVGPSARLVGGYAIGIITGERLGYNGYQVGVAVFSSGTLQFDLLIEKGLPDNEHAVGRALGEQLKRKHPEGVSSLLLMYDSIKGRPREGSALNLNLATPLIEGLESALGSWPDAAGVGMMGDFQSSPTFQWFDDRIEQQSATALVFSGGVRMDTAIMHGCRPSGGYHTITRAEGNVVLEIDGRPAVDAIAAALGPVSSKSWEEWPYFITLGVNKGDRFGAFKEEEYANRLVMGVDKERGGLIMFEPDLQAGAEVQLMRRSIDFSYMVERAEALLQRLEGRKPLFALYIDCAGRAAAYCGTDGEEAEVIQKVIGARMPLLGMYSGVEVAQVGGRMQALDWTGVLCVFTHGG